MRFSFTLVLLFVCIFESQGSGIQLRLDGHRRLGMGGAGVAFSEDASIMTLNPGGLVFVPKKEIQFGAGFVYPATSFLARTPSIYTENMVGGLFDSPIYLHASYKLPGSRLAFGVSVHQPYWYSSNWPQGWKGRFIVQKSSFTSLFIQPTLSYHLTERFGVGVGVIYGIGSTTLRKGLPISVDNDSESSAELSGSGSGVGFMVGVLWKPELNVAVGLSYKSAFSIDINNGQATFVVPPSLAGLYPQTTFQTQFEIPHQFLAGVSIESSNEFQFNIDLNYGHWSSIDTLVIAYDTVTRSLRNENIVRNYKDAWSVLMGGEYSINEKLQIRGGVFYEGTPIRTDFVSPELPDADHVGFTAGLGWQIARPLAIDLAYRFEFSGERSGFHVTYQFGGTYERISSHLGIALRFAF